MLNTTYKQIDGNTFLVQTKDDYMYSVALFSDDAGCEPYISILLEPPLEYPALVTFHRFFSTVENRELFDVTHTTEVD